MTPDIAGEWVAVVALGLCLVAGVMVMGLSARTAWVARSLAALTLAYGFLGLVFLTVPKWHEIAIKVAGFEARIAQLEDAKSQLTEVKQNLESQVAQFEQDRQTISQLASVNSSENAADWAAQAERIRSRVKWADFLPANQAALKLAVRDAPEATDLANQLGVSASDLVNTINRSGYTLLKDAQPAGLQSSPATDVWLPAVSNK